MKKKKMTEYAYHLEGARAALASAKTHIWAIRLLLLEQPEGLQRWLNTDMATQAIKDIDAANFDVDDLIAGYKE